MPIEDYRAAATTISDFLKLLTTTGGLRLKYRITAGEGAADPDGLEAREIYVEIAGPDAGLVTQRNGELLRALEHVAAKMVRLEPEEHDRISFDSGNFKAMRAREMKMAADAAAERVRRGAKAREEIPDFTDRSDEIGHLSGSLRDMTRALYDRIEAIENCNRCREARLVDRLTEHDTEENR